MHPNIINKHPEADIPFPGIKSKLIQAGQQQFIFMEFEQDVEIPEHTHEAQWGVILEGQMKMTINGIERVLTKGDTYFIEANTPHSVKIYKGCRDLTLFDQKDRYNFKS